MSGTGQRLGRWLLDQMTWRNTVRVCGLTGMMWVTLTEAHPDPTALVALGTMVGLPTFFGLTPLGSRDERKDEHKP